MKPCGDQRSLHRAWVATLALVCAASCGDVAGKLETPGALTPIGAGQRESPQQQNASEVGTGGNPGPTAQPPPGAGGTTPPPVPPPEEVSPNQPRQLALQATMTQKVADEFAPLTFLSSRGPGILWVVEDKANSRTRAVDATNGAVVGQAVSPCASLPQLESEPGARVLPAGTRNCWSVDHARVTIVRHYEDPQAGVPSAFFVSNVSWDVLGRTFTKDQFAGFSLLGLTQTRLVLASAHELIVLSLDNGSFGLLALDLRPLKLPKAPEAGAIRVENSKRVINLMLAKDLYVATETGAGTRLFQWAQYRLELAAGASSGLGAQELTTAPWQVRTVTEENDQGEPTTRHFVELGTKLYGVSLGAVPTPPPASREWEGLAFLKTYCATCHSAPQGSSGGLRLVGDNQEHLLETLKIKRALIIQRMNLPRPNVLAMPPYASLPSDAEKRSFEDALNRL